MTQLFQDTNLIYQHNIPKDVRSTLFVQIYQGYASTKTIITFIASLQHRSVLTFDKC